MSDDVCIWWCLQCNLVDLKLLLAVWFVFSYPKLATSFVFSSSTSLSLALMTRALALLLSFTNFGFQRLLGTCRSWSVGNLLAFIVQGVCVYRFWILPTLCEKPWCKWGSAWLVWALVLMWRIYFWMLLDHCNLCTHEYWRLVARSIQVGNSAAAGWKLVL